MKIITYSLAILKDIGVNLLAAIILGILMNEANYKAGMKYLLLVGLISTLVYIIYAIKNRIKTINEEEKLGVIIKNIWDESLRKDQIKGELALSDMYQNRLDDILKANIDSKFKNRCWEDLQRIAKKKLEGLDIGHSGIKL